MKSLQIIKVGGALLENPELSSVILEKFHAIDGAKILVHGGGRRATQLATQLGIETKMIEGKRVTDPKSLEIATMVYAGLVNKTLVSQLQALGTNCIGLTGADLNSITTIKRPVNPVDYGLVGDTSIEGVSTDPLINLLTTGISPVFCAITHDGKGQLLNTNADSVASVLAAALAKHFDITLTYCFELDGVMRDINDQNSLIEQLNEEKINQLKAEQVIKEGMIPKLEGALNSVKEGVSKVRIQHARHLGSDYGTTIQLH
jgi:acetylglutamate kinase